MPDKKTLEAVRKDKAAGKSPSTQAGELVREEMDHIREGKHGARSAKQAIAIGLSKARRAGVKLGEPRTGSPRTKKQAARDTAKAKRKKPRSKTKPVSKTRSRATTRALKKEGSAAASPRALSRHARSAAKKRTAADRSASAKKGARTKGAAARSRAAKKAARTRAAA